MTELFCESDCRTDVFAHNVPDVDSINVSICYTVHNYKRVYEQDLCRVFTGVNDTSDDRVGSRYCDKTAG